MLKSTKKTEVLWMRKAWGLKPICQLGGLDCANPSGGAQILQNK